MKRISCKKLSEKLKEVGIIKTPEELKSACEAYGKDVRCYISTGSPEKRAEVERFLRRNDISFNSDYWPGSGTVEIKVSYFKAWHYDI